LRLESRGPRLRGNSRCRVALVTARKAPPRRTELPLRSVLDTIAEEATGTTRSPAAPNSAATVLDALCNRAPCAAFVANNVGAFVAANQAACELTGYTRSELLHQSVWDITPTTDEREAETLWRAFLQQGEQSGTYRVARKDKSIVAADYLARANVLPGLHVSLLRAQVTED
jgi:PAS domain S-box-containing protein